MKLIDDFRTAEQDPHKTKMVSLKDILKQT